MAGRRPFTVSAEYGLALAAVAGAPVRVPDKVMDRLGVSVPGEDQETSPRPLPRRFEPRNLAFTGGLDHWQLRGTFLRQGTGFDYSATTEDGRAILAAAGPEPAGFAFLAQEIEPDDYRTRRLQPRPARATPGGRPRSLGRPGQPHRLRHRNRRVDPV